MTPRRFILLPLLLAAATLSAQDAPVATDAAVASDPPVEAAGEPVATPEVEEETLPTGFPVTRYTAIWENSPFNREVIPAVAQTIESSFAQTLVLEGVINDDEKGPIAYVRDNREDKPLVITTAKTDSHPYTIVSANQSNRPEETKITITDGKETGEIGFEVASLTQAIAQPVSAAPQQKAGKPDPRAGGSSTPNFPQGAGQVGGQGGGGAQAGGARPANTPQIGTPAASGTPTSVTPALDALDSEPRRRRVPLPGATN